MLNIGDTKMKKRLLAYSLIELINSIHTVLFQQDQPLLWDWLNQLNYFLPELMTNSKPDQEVFIFLLKWLLVNLLSTSESLSRNEPEDGLRAQLFPGESCSHFNNSHESVSSIWTSCPSCVNLLVTLSWKDVPQCWSSYSGYIRLLGKAIMHQYCIHWFPFMFHIKRPVTKNLDFFFLFLIAVRLNN